MDITHKLSIKSTPETVFRAVSTESGINGWWAKAGNVGETVGTSSNLKFNKAGNIVEMGFKTTELIPNQRVVWECVTNPNPAWIGTSVVTDISEAENGSDVVFSHSGFDEKWKGQEPFEMTKGGWEHFMNSLVSYCEKGEGQPW